MIQYIKWPTYEQALGKWEEKTCFLTGRNDRHNRAQGRAAISPDQFGVRGGRVQKTHCGRDPETNINN